MKTKEMQLLSKSKEVAKETDKSELNSEIFKKEDIKDTPFTCIFNDNDCFIVMGNARISHVHGIADKEKLIKEHKRFNWDRLIQVLGVLKEVKFFENK